jgi:hypothetical protein
MCPHHTGSSFDFLLFIFVISLTKEAGQSFFSSLGAVPSPSSLSEQQALSHLLSQAALHEELMNWRYVNLTAGKRSTR